MALHEMPAESRQYRHLQPQLLRGDPGCSRASRIPLQTEGAAVADYQEHLGRAFPGHSRLRTLSAPQRNSGREVLPPSLRGGAKEALFGSCGCAGEELEILRGRHGRAKFLGCLSNGL